MINATHPNTSERGQAIILLALAMVGLLGFAGLAIDGGNIYTEQRRAQAAADNAAMAAAFDLMSGIDEYGQLSGAALDTAGRNGYDNNTVDNWVTLNRPPTQGPNAGNPEYIEVVVTQTLQTALAHFVYQGPVQVTARAVTRGFEQQPPVAGFAIITLNNCRETGVSNIRITGGGNSGGVWAHDGGIWLNTTETSGSNDCAMSPGNSSGGHGITTTLPNQIHSTGGYNYAGESKIFPNPIQTNANGGVPLADPLASLIQPTCTANGSGNGSAGNPYQPGRYGGSGQPGLGAGLLQPGIYCVTGNVSLAGNNSMQGDGVVMVMLTGGLRFTGNAWLRLTGPTHDSCLGVSGDTNATCNYTGIVFWGARTNCGTVLGAGGNGDINLTGTVYAPCATYRAHGGGSDPEEWEVRGQLIVGNILGNGNGSFIVWYDENYVYELPPFVQMVQ